jgi:hypothetical protein
MAHANLSQTSTYLHAAEMGFQESIRRFVAPFSTFCGKTWQGRLLAYYRRSCSARFA